MKRRVFLVGLSLSALSLPAFAQRPLKLIGMITAFSKDDARPLVDAFTAKLGTQGWELGKNFELDVRYTGADPSSIKDAISSLLSLRPDVIVAQGSPILDPLKKLAPVSPIVFTLVSDPVGLGLVDSLSKPGGNITGFTNFEFSVGSKWVELVQELGTGVSEILLLANPGNRSSEGFVKMIEAAGTAVKINIRTVSVRNSMDIEAAIRSHVRRGRTAIVTLPDSLPVINRDLIVALANELNAPNVHPFRIFPTHGGLMSYGIDYPEVYRQTATYADRILRGAKPAQLPVQAPNKFELVVNLRTAKSFGINLPSSLLARADEVIE